MVRVHLLDQYNVWLYKTELVGFDNFVKLLKAGIIVKVGKVYTRKDWSI